MKRFFIDFMLIIIIVVLGNSLINKPIDYKIKEYEETIIYPNEQTSNKMTWLVKKSGDMIENVVEISVELISLIFKAIIE